MDLGTLAHRICSLSLVLLAAPPSSAEDFRPLFNGQNLDGWVIEGPKQRKQGQEVVPVWSVKDGMIVADAGRDGYGFLRYAKQPFKDFVFRVEYRMTPPAGTVPRGNSGLGIRTVPFDPAHNDTTRPSYAAYEIQLLDDAGKPPSAHGSGSLYRYLAPTENAVKPAPEWNLVEVECAGHTVRVTINGRKVIDADQRTLPDLRADDKPSTAPAPKDKPLSGFVCLQSHTGRVEFRRVEIREIPAARGDSR